MNNDSRRTYIDSSIESRLLLSEGTNLRFVLQSLIPFQNPAIAIDLDALGPEEREICRQQD